MEISVVPLGLGDASVGDFVAGVIRYLQQEGIPFELTDMGTLISRPRRQVAEGGPGPARTSL